MSSLRGKECYELSDAASKVRSADYVGLQSRDEFNAAAEHVFGLIVAAAALLKSGHHAPAIFMAITSFEEIAKIKAGHARSWGQPLPDVKRGKDPLFSHDVKHKIAVDPVVLIGNRLADTIGKERVEEIFARYGDGTYSNLREKSLYFDRDKDGLKIPAQQISQRNAIEHILVAIELFDDFFFCMTQNVSEACERLNSLFDEIAPRLKSG